MFLALVFPRLSLEVFGPEVDDESAAPAALCTHKEILLPNLAAQNAGVHPGTRRATALALAPDLRLLESNPALEQQAIEHLACLGLHYTPLVSLVSKPHAAGLLLDVDASLTYFGGIAPLLTRLRADLTREGFTAHIAYAPTASGAYLLAQAHSYIEASTQARLNAALLALDIGLVPSAHAQQEVLRSMGVNDLRALLQLPRAGLARRFGQALLDEIDRAFGKQPEAFAWFSAPKTFHSKLELMAQVEFAQGLIFGAQRLINPLCLWLQALHAAVQSIVLRAFHDDAPPTEIRIEFSQATREKERMLSVLKEKLERLTLPEAAHTLSLDCQHIEILPGTNAELFFKAANQQDNLLKLVERLQARLGREQVLSLGLHQDYRPEKAQRWLAYANTKQRAKKPKDADGPQAHIDVHGIPRPLWLYRQPLAIREKGSSPWFNGPVQLLAGPERIEGAWWADQETSATERDYFIGLSQEQQMLWLFRSDAWYLQGVFG